MPEMITPGGIKGDPFERPCGSQNVVRWNFLDEFWKNDDAWVPSETRPAGSESNPRGVAGAVRYKRPRHAAWEAPAPEYADPRSCPSTSFGDGSRFIAERTTSAPGKPWVRRKRCRRERKPRVGPKRATEPAR